MACLLQNPAFPPRLIQHPQTKQIMDSQAMADPVVNILHAELRDTPSIAALAWRLNPPADPMTEEEKHILRHAVIEDFALAGLDCYWRAIVFARQRKKLDNRQELDDWHDFGKDAFSLVSILRRSIAEKTLRMAGRAVHERAIQFLQTCPPKRLLDIVKRVFKTPNSNHDQIVRRVLFIRKNIKTLMSLKKVAGFRTYYSHSFRDFLRRVYVLSNAPPSPSELHVQELTPKSRVQELSQQPVVKRPETLTLEELRSILRPHERYADVAASYYGLVGSLPKTMEEISDTSNIPLHKIRAQLRDFPRFLRIRGWLDTLEAYRKNRMGTEPGPSLPKPATFLRYMLQRTREERTYTVSITDYEALYGELQQSSVFWLYDSDLLVRERQGASGQKQWHYQYAVSAGLRAWLKACSALEELMLLSINDGDKLRALFYVGYQLLRGNKTKAEALLSIVQNPHRDVLRLLYRSDFRPSYQTVAEKLQLILGSANAQNLYILESDALSHIWHYVASHHLVDMQKRPMLWFPHLFGPERIPRFRRPNSQSTQERDARGRIRRFFIDGIQDESKPFLEFKTEADAKGYIRLTVPKSGHSGITMALATGLKRSGPVLVRVTFAPSDTCTVTITRPDIAGESEYLIHKSAQGKWAATAIRYASQRRLRQALKASS